MKTHIVLPFAALVAFAAPVTYATEKDKPVRSAQVADKKAPTDRKATEKGPAPETRNWAAVDTNKDNLVSPEEMEAYLKANPGPLKGK